MNINNEDYLSSEFSQIPGICFARKTMFHLKISHGYATTKLSIFH